MIKKFLVGLFSIALIFSFSVNNVSAETSEEEAVEKAQSYAENQFFSKDSLYEQLVSDSGEGYSDELAEHAVNNVDIDWKERALEYAEFLEDDGYSEEEIERTLGLEEFTEDEIQYALGNSDDSDADEEENDNENNDETEDSEDNEGTNDDQEESDDQGDEEQNESDDNQDNNTSDEQESTENNDDEQQAEESTNDNASNNEDENDEATVVESNDGSDDEEGGRLPDTATSTFNWLLVGGASLAAGGLGVFLTRKKKAAAQK